MKYKIKIIKCSNPSYWYEKQIGSEFFVEPKDKKTFLLIGDYSIGIDTDDCEILETIKPKIVPFNLSDDQDFIFDIIFNAPITDGNSQIFRINRVTEELILTSGGIYKYEDAVEKLKYYHKGEWKPFGKLMRSKYANNKK